MNRDLVESSSSSDEEIIIIRRRKPYRSKTLSTSTTSLTTKTDLQSQSPSTSPDFIKDSVSSHDDSDKKVIELSSSNEDHQDNNDNNNSNDKLKSKKLDSCDNKFCSISSLDEEIEILENITKQISITDNKDDDDDDDSGIGNAGSNQTNENSNSTKEESWYDAVDDRKRIILEEYGQKRFVEVDPGLCSILKPHQIDGIRFMYECVIQSVECFKTNTTNVNQPLGGCILAHSMGLGKTLQVVALVHTLFTDDLIQNYIKRCLVIVPLNVAQNWHDEFIQWFRRCHNYRKRSIKLWKMYEAKTLNKRRELLRDWKRYGGVMIITSRLATTMIANSSYEPSFRFLCKGPDLVVIDEGHLLKNNQTAFYKSVAKIQTKRRIILTGTPMQNNLSEYFCMIDMIKPKLLGSKDRFKVRFEMPITRGQMSDSTEFEMKLMKKRIHVLTRMLKNHVHRCDYNVLVPYLPPKLEFVLGVRLSPIQAKMYRYYINHLTGRGQKNLLKDSMMLLLLGNHPSLLLESYKKNNPEVFDDYQNYWWRKLLTKEQQENIDRIEYSTKFQLMFSILDHCEEIGDKLLIFSLSIPTLNLIEKFLEERGWIKNKDYYRIDGQVDVAERHSVIEHFNDPQDSRSRLMLISTRAGGLGINLVGANRCILMDCSWNPAHDSQAIFRVFRLGQKKPVYIYRLVAYGTMEWKIYQRQVHKQSLSKRVVDEQHIIRNYTQTQLAELYTFSDDAAEKDDDDGDDSDGSDVMLIPDLPKDNLLADLLLMYGRKIVSYHEHDTLLEQRPEEELNENEKREAWIEYVRDKQQQQQQQQQQVPAQNQDPVDHLPSPALLRMKQPVLRTYSIEDDEGGDDDYHDDDNDEGEERGEQRQIEYIDISNSD